MPLVHDPQKEAEEQARLQLITSTTVPESKQDKERVEILRLSVLASFELVLECSNLRKLFVNNVHLGDIPSSLSQLAKLEQLRLQNCKVTSLPYSIDKLTSLQLLDMSNNLLTTVPSTIGNIQTLTLLILRANPIRRLPTSLLPNLKFGKLIMEYLISDLQPPMKAFIKKDPNRMQDYLTRQLVVDEVWHKAKLIWLGWKQEGCAFAAMPKDIVKVISDFTFAMTLKLVYLPVQSVEYSFGQRDRMPWSEFEAILNTIFFNRPKLTLQFKEYMCDGDEAIKQRWIDLFTFFKPPIRLYQWQDSLGCDRVWKIEQVAEVIDEQYFVGNMTSEEAAKVAQTLPSGTYLLRFSSQPETLAFSFPRQERVCHFRVFLMQGSFGINSPLKIRVPDIKSITRTMLNNVHMTQPLDRVAWRQSKESVVRPYDN